MRRPILLVTMNGDSPVTGFASRVWLMAESLKKRGESVHLLRLYPAFKSQGSWQDGAVARGVILREIPLLPISRYPLARFFTMLVANFCIHLYARAVGAKLIQAEAHESAYAVLKNTLTNTPVVVDFHGACIEEARNRRELERRDVSLQWLEKAEQLAVSKAAACLVVSRAMINYLKQKHGQIYVSPTYEVPICVENDFFLPLEREFARHALGVPASSPLLVYCGGAQEYQCLDEMRELLVALIAVLPDVHLLIISRDEKKFQDVFRGLENRITLRSVASKEVPHLLIAADAGLLLRRDHVLNRVSCPTKFAEYLACGVPVITTPFAGHAGELVYQYAAGVVLSDPATGVDTVADLLRTPRPLAERMRLQGIAAHKLHWHAAETVLFTCHDQVLSMNKEALNL